MSLNLAYSFDVLPQSWAYLRRFFCLLSFISIPHVLHVSILTISVSTLFRYVTSFLAANP